MTTAISNHAARTDAPHEMAIKLSDAAARKKQLEDSTPEEARRLRQEWGNPFAPPGCDIPAMEDIFIPIRDGNIVARVYKPAGEAAELQPALVFFHGGGFVLGNVELYDTVCQQLAHLSRCMVFSIEYTLAPDHKILQIHAEGFAAYRWIADNATRLGIDKSRIAIGGDSAGGNLSIAVTLACKRESVAMPAYQVLIYPSVDLAMSFPSVNEFAHGYYLTRAGMRWFRSHYLESPSQAEDPQLNFLAADLEGLPPAYLLTAGFDPLRDEGEAYAERLAQFGVPVLHECYTDMIHAFVSFAGGIPPGMHALRRIGELLQRNLSRK